MSLAKKVCFSILVLLFSISAAFARGGGGGGGGGGYYGNGASHHGFHWTFIDIVFVCVAIFGVLLVIIFYIYGTFTKRGRKGMASSPISINKSLGISRGSIVSIGKKIFSHAQDAWVKQDLQTLEKLLAPDLYNEWVEKIKKQRENNIKNEISNLEIIQKRLSEIKEKDGKLLGFTIFFEAKIIDNFFKNGVLLTKFSFENWFGKEYVSFRGTFCEEWTFIKVDNEWRASKIAVISNTPEGTSNSGVDYFLSSI